MKLRQYKLNKNIVFGSSGLIGTAFYNLVRKDKNFIFFSKSNKKFKLLDFNSNLSKFPYKEINRCYFFSSPRIIKKNFKQNNFKLEFEWLKKLIVNIKIDSLIYISSSSVYYKKKNLIGLTKLKCEKYIIKNKNLFFNYQIWRPFNIIGEKYTNSDHFHNYLFKQMFLKKKKSSTFQGNASDMRGYASVDHFVKVLYKFSKINNSFVRDYGNKDLVKISEVINLFNIYYKKINKKNFKPFFKSNFINISKIMSKKNSVFYNKKSITVLKNYLQKSINEK